MHCRLQSSQLHGNRLNHYVGEWHRSTSVHNMFNRMIVLDPRYELQNLMIACGLDTCGRLLVMARADNVGLSRGLESTSLGC